MTKTIAGTEALSPFYIDIGYSGGWWPNSMVTRMPTGNTVVYKKPSIKIRVGVPFEDQQK